MAALTPTQVDRYLERIGLDPTTVRDLDLDTPCLTTLQTAHATHIPFENLSIVGDPFTDTPGPGISLDRQAIYAKLIDRERGGYCFELNGLFTTLLTALGFDVHRAAAMVIPNSGDHRTPANHHIAIVSLDTEYVVDVGMGSPRMRHPTPLDGTPTDSDDAHVTWRIRETDRPQYRYRAEYRIGDGEWEPRHDFDPTPREFTYFQAANDYLANAPESPFTSGPVVERGTPDGWIELQRDTFTRVTRGDTTEREIDAEDWYQLLESEFHLTLPP